MCDRIGLVVVHAPGVHGLSAVAVRTHCAHRLKIPAPRLPSLLLRYCWQPMHCHRLMCPPPPEPKRCVKSLTALVRSVMRPNPVFELDGSEPGAQRGPR